ncbi:oligosaccharide flippase family protein [Halobacillus sp. GSS1]|uniref:oligosaccharide flippase family protein n=1 Tax=Halobacillus sp. GSS1 TaxID=2815919 RepID=UPI001A8DCC50|nr:oligosaccharide flippase family protein [Halobacillus sp. GSS1]
MDKEKKNSIASNILHLFYSTALSSILNAAALIVLASYLQSSHYGVFSVALAFAMIMGYFTDAGLSDITLRESSKPGVKLPELISSYVKMRLTLLVATFFIGFTIIHFFNSSNGELIRTAYYLIIPMVTGVALQSIGTTFYQLIEKMQYYGLIRMVSSFCLVTAMVVGMGLQLNPLTMCMLYGLSYLTAGIFGLVLVMKDVSIRFAYPFHKGLFKNLGSFTLGGLLFVLLPHIGPIILEKTIPIAAVGLFAVAYRIPQALQQIPFIVAGAYYPVLFRSFQHQNLREHLNHQISQTKIMSLVGMMMVLPFFYLSEYVIKILFGTEWLGAAFPLKVLSLMLLLQSVNIALADGLTTMEKQNSRTFIQLVTVIVGLGLYITLSLSYGVIGAAVTGVAIEVLALIGFWVCSPNRWVLFKRSLFPYLSYFFTGLLIIEWVGNLHAMLALPLHTTLVLLLPLLDTDLRRKLYVYTQQLLLKYKQGRVPEHSGGVENGPSKANGS